MSYLISKEQLDKWIGTISIAGREACVATIEEIWSRGYDAGYDQALEDFDDED